MGVGSTDRITVLALSYNWVLSRRSFWRQQGTLSLSRGPIQLQHS
jgi:hypothetical protein